MKNSKLKNYAKTIISIQNLMAITPAYVIEKTKPEEVQQLLSSAYETCFKLFHSYNWAA